MKTQQYEVGAFLSQRHQGELGTSLGDDHEWRYPTMHGIGRAASMEARECI
jgi:hypothetical protein